MLQSSSTNQQPPSRVSPVMESEEDYTYDTDDYSSIQTHANGEPYMVTDVYHQPMPLATPQGSDSGPEYSTPFAHNGGGGGGGSGSPGSHRRVFSPPPTSFPTGTKQKPRMGVMAARNLSDKTSKPNEVRTLASDDTENPSLSQISDDDYESPVYDSAQYIVTPTRRRNSENEKSVNGRTLNRREAGGGLEYPEVRGRLGESEELAAVPPGVVLLQPNIYQDGSLDSQMMSEIELANLRATMRLSPDPETISGDSSTAHDRLLTGNHVMNGNGAAYPNHHHQHKHHHPNHHHHSFDLGSAEAPPPRPRPGSGSGAVFRRRRAPCWCVLLVLVAVALLAAGISLGVLFGVMKAAEDSDTPLQDQDQDKSTLHPSSLPTRSPGGGVFGGNRPDNSSDSAGGPTSLRTPSNPSGSVVEGGGETGGRKEGGLGAWGVGGGGPGWGVSVRRFKAYWHPGDSRVMEVLLSNGTRLEATGLKKNDGTFSSLYSLTVTNGQGRTTRVWFSGGRSLGSVLLPDGTAVNLDWSANDADIECKIFQIPPPRGAPGGALGGGSPNVLAPKPTSHLATLQLGVHSYLLRQITKTLAEASEASDKQDEDEPTPPPVPKICTPRLPVKVTKCGGQYPYDGAFVQGEIAVQTGPSLVLAALPWKRQDDEDECYRDLSASTPNFFIPLPGHIERRTARVMAERFWHTSAAWWRKVCDVVGTMLVLDLRRQEVCANMAASSQAQLHRIDLYKVVFDSCSAVLNSLHLACRTLHELTTRAAATANRGGGGGSGASRAGSRKSLTHDLLHRVLANATSLQEPATIPEQDVHVTTHAFCPSTQPLTAQETSVTLQASSGGVWSRDITAADTVHVDCMGHPEVTYFYLGHAAAIHPLEMVKHRLKVCAVCAYDTTLSVHVQRDHMCCNDTCSRESRCEDSVSAARAGLGLRESHTVREHGSVYCHEFLTAADTPTRALHHACMGTCQSNLQVRFQIKDAEEDGSISMAGGRVYFDQVMSCLEGYRSTCKSTFGH